jgi:ketosteroid isomerase-like protein
MRRAGFGTLTGAVVVMAAATTGAACAGADVGGSSEPQRRTEDNRRIVTTAFERWAAGSTSFFTDVVAEDVVWRIEGSGPSAGVFRGRAEFVQKAVVPFTSRLSSPVRPIEFKVLADGDHVISHWEGRATARDGREYRNRYAWIFRMQDAKAVEAWAFLDLAPYDDILRRIPAAKEQLMTTNPYVGMWVTDDGYIRHELLPSGRYDEARGRRQSAYQGRYEITGTHIEYWDDTGFTADGDFVDENTLHHGGMIFRRRKATNVATSGSTSAGTSAPVRAGN